MRQSSFRRDKHLTAFSLLEMSLVIVIIGILVGGITIGSSLYDNYKLMTIVSDAERIKMAAKNFKDQYQYFPGDFARATAIWGTISSPACNGATGTTSAVVSSATCNGMGNGVIGQAGSNVQEVRERFFLWQHLNLAGYLPDQYSGFASDASNDASISPGLNVPRLKYNKALGYTLNYTADSYTTVSAARSFPVQGKLGHIFSWSTPNVGVATASLINAKDALKLDTKMDDGLPLSGRVFADGTIAACFTGTDYSTSVINTCGQYYRNFLEE